MRLRGERLELGPQALAQQRATQPVGVVIVVRDGELGQRAARGLGARRHAVG